MPDYAAQRLTMVESQVRTNDVTDDRILDAMRLVARERFVPAAARSWAYADRPIEIAPGRFLLDPRTLSKLVQLAEIEPSDRILDIGCGSGYSTAILSQLGNEVVGLDEDAELVRIASDVLAPFRNVRIVQGRLAEGSPQGAPYDVIFVNGAVQLFPDGILRQLAGGGRAAAVIQEGPQGRAHLFLREHGRIGDRPDFDATAPILPGFTMAPAFVF